MSALDQKADMTASKTSSLPIARTPTRFRCMKGSWARNRKTASRRSLLGRFAWGLQLIATQKVCRRPLLYDGGVESTSEFNGQVAVALRVGDDTIEKCADCVARAILVVTCASQISNNSVNYVRTDVLVAMTRYQHSAGGNYVTGEGVVP
jgi:hypothetical protein